LASFLVLIRQRLAKTATANPEVPGYRDKRHADSNAGYRQSLSAYHRKWKVRGSLPINRKGSKRKNGGMPLRKEKHMVDPRSPI
jgi:hypothetical protein